MPRAKQRAQAILELALCLAIVATTIGSMAIYIQRGLRARYRAGVIHCVKNITAGEYQYEPYLTREAYTAEEKEGLIETGWGTRSTLNMTTNTSGWNRIPLPVIWSRSRE